MLAIDYEVHHLERDFVAVTFGLHSTAHANDRLDLVVTYGRSEPLDARRLHTRVRRDRLLARVVRSELPEHFVEVREQRRKLRDLALEVSLDEKVADLARLVRDLPLNLVHPRSSNARVVDA
jgi:hypothetical protein